MPLDNDEHCDAGTSMYIAPASSLGSMRPRNNRGSAPPAITTTVIGTSSTARANVKALRLPLEGPKSLPATIEAVLLGTPCLWAGYLFYRRACYRECAYLIFTLLIACLCLLRFSFAGRNKGRRYSATNGYRANAKNPGFFPGLIIPPLVLSAIILALPTDAEGVAYFRVLLQSLLFNSSVFGLRHLSHGVQVCGGLALIVVSIAAGKVDNVAQYVAVFTSTTVSFAGTHVLTRFMLQDSVSIGEALTISLSLSAFLSDAVVTTFQKVHLATLLPRFHGGLGAIVWKSANVGNIGIFPRSEVYIFMHALVLGMLAIGVVSMPLLRKIRASDSTNARTQHIALSTLFFGIAALAVLLGIRPWTWMLIVAEPFLWTYEFVTSSSTRIALSAFWALLISIAVAIAVHKFPPTVSTSSALNLKRKYFHVLATTMFLPGYLIDPEYMHLAFSVASSALILIEYIRFFNIWPLGQGIHNFMCQFLNERDSGPVVLSHLYLLSGCALPVWLNKIAMQSVLGGLSGILTLGIGDTMASVCGKRFGRIHWPGTSKTVEGTLAFVLSISTALLMLSSLHIVAIDSWTTIMACVTLSSLLEAFSDQNDNLIIPLYTFGMLHLLTAK